MTKSQDEIFTPTSQSPDPQITSWDTNLMVLHPHDVWHLPQNKHVQNAQQQETDIEDMNRSTLHGETLAEAVSRAPSEDKLPMRRFSNGTPSGSTLETTSPSSSVRAWATMPVHPVLSQPKKDLDSAELDHASNISQAENERRLRQDVISDPRPIHLSEMSLRRGPEQFSQLPGPFLPGITSQDTLHGSQVSQREMYLLKVCRVFMMYGAPTHRLEEYMCMTADVLGLHIQSFYMPGCMIVSSGGTAQHPPQVHIVRCIEALNLSKLHDVHEVYKAVIHKRISVDEATVRLEDIIAATDIFPKWCRILAYGLASASIGPVSYGARPIDLPIIFLLGSLLGIMELDLAKRSELYAHLFEISAAIVTSFVARAFGSIRSEPSTSLCFAATCQASLVLILPGLIVTKSALELQSKNFVSGSVRMVYGVIFTLFLAFGITIGAALYGAMDSGATSATTCATSWPFWWQVIFVPAFTLFYIIINQGRWSKVPAMLVLSLAGWLVNHFSDQRFAASPQVTQVLGALTVGILANLYSRLGFGLAVELMYPAVFIQVPGNLAASGSLIGGLIGADQLVGSGGNTMAGNGTVAANGMQPNNAALNAGYAMVEIGISITVGLSVSALVVYPIRKRTGKSGLFSF